MTAKEYLLATHGAYVGYGGLVEILGGTRSAGALRALLARSDTEFARRLRTTRRYVGRRVLFDVGAVADILQGSREAGA